MRLSAARRRRKAVGRVEGAASADFETNRRRRSQQQQFREEIKASKEKPHENHKQLPLPSLVTMRIKRSQ